MFRMMSFGEDELKKFLVKAVLGNITPMGLVSPVFLLCGFIVLRETCSPAVITYGLCK